MDPCSAWTAKANKRVQFGYGLNYLIDIANAIIVDQQPDDATWDPEDVNYNTFRWITAGAGFSTWRAKLSAGARMSR